jgi:hypothetical protein
MVSFSVVRAKIIDRFIWYLITTFVIFEICLNKTRVGAPMQNV